MNELKQQQAAMINEINKLKNENLQTDESDITSEHENAKKQPIYDVSSGSDFNADPVFFRKDLKPVSFMNSEAILPKKDKNLIESSHRLHHEPPSQKEEFQAVNHYQDSAFRIKEQTSPFCKVASSPSLMSTEILPQINLEKAKSNS